MRLVLPQPYAVIEHTADTGVAVEGASPEEALARLVLAFGQLAAGGETAEPSGEERLAVAGGPDLAGTAVAALREVHWRLAARHLLPVACEVHRVDAAGAELTVAFGRWDPERHAEGADVKAITRHAARLEPGGSGWRAQAIFDV